MENKNIVGWAALALGILAVGLVVGLQLGVRSVSKDISVNVTNGGASAGGSSPSLLSSAAGRSPADEFRFGAVSGTQSSTLGTQTTVSTTGQILSNTQLEFAVNAGTIATSTASSVTSTFNITGRACFILRSPTGTLWTAIFQNGDWLATPGGTCG